MGGRFGSGAAVLALATALAALTGCSSEDSGPVTASGDPADCPGAVVDVVVSVAQWGTLVDDLGGDCANVTTVLTSSAGDPHEYEPSTGDIAAFENADLVVYNGLGYDEWARKAVAGLSSRPPVIDVAELAGAKAGDDPHLWYDPELVPTFADAVTAQLSALSPDATPYLDQQRRRLTGRLEPFVAALATLRSAAGGRTYAATEPVFSRTAAAVGLADATPARYRDAAANDSEPSPGDLAEFEASLADGRIDVLVVNTQTSGTVPDQLRAAAEAADVPVVTVTESPPSDDVSFVPWQVGQLEALTAALEKSS